MKSSYLLTHPLSLVRHFLATSMLIAFCSICRSAEESPPAKAGSSNFISADELVIANGVFNFGKPTPATMRNLVDTILRLRFPEMNITLTGAEDVRVENATIRWRKRPLTEDVSNSGAVRATLSALREASGRKIEVQDFGPNDFVISAVPGAGTRRLVEVFRLSLLTGEPSGAEVTREITRLEVERSLMADSFGAEHPKMKQNAGQIDRLKRQLADASAKPAPDQIRDAVRMTLEELKSGEPLPEFKYHPGTGLMIVIGGEQGLEITRKVVAALR
ncbi:MAG: hypothetical protein ABIO94_03570 [Opitutaceae bacterium]